MTNKAERRIPMTTTTRDNDRGREKPAEQATRRRKSREGGEVTGRRLGVPKSMLDLERFTYRWVNDTPGRMYAMTVEDDWTPVLKEGEKDASHDLGNAVSYVAGSKADGSAMNAYLCQKPKGFFDDDQREKQIALDAQDRELKRGKDRNGATQSDYTPHSGIKIS
jgi:hypothetical protein